MFLADCNRIQLLFSCRYVSGSMHYSRVPAYYWKDRLLKMKAAGLNAVQTYVPWNFHEPFPGMYDFEEDHDLVNFIKTAQQVGLLVILRAGPYICAEWDMGGLPSWLLRNTSVSLRSSDPYYMQYVDQWLAALLPKVKPLLYENGGPIIMVQVENEYGSYPACDKVYLQHLESEFRKYLGSSVVLFTTDGNSDTSLKCGTIPSMYATVDFGITADPAVSFRPQRDYEPHGPLVNSEFYTGWLDYWGYPHQQRDSAQVANCLDKILALNASVNMYMFEGGTNFGFWNGADAPLVYLPVPTSYDYDAPLTEAGDPWEKLTAIQNVIKKYLPVSSPIPPATPKAAYGKVKMTLYSSLLGDTRIVTRTETADDPLTFEELEQNYGFVMYTSTSPIHIVSSVILEVEDLHDRASVYWDGVLQGVLMRNTSGSGLLRLTINTTTPTDATLVLVVENMGRIDYGPNINDRKGILGRVTVNGKVVKGWESQSLPLNNTNQLVFNALAPNMPNNTVFFKGMFSASSQPNDTYLNVDNWSKGVAFVNGFNLGRYWPSVGPQKTLFVPKTVLKASEDSANELILFEIDASPCHFPDISGCYATFVDTPDIGSH